MLSNKVQYVINNIPVRLNHGDKLAERLEHCKTAQGLWHRCQTQGPWAKRGQPPQVLFDLKDILMS